MLQSVAELQQAQQPVLQGWKPVRGARAVHRKESGGGVESAKSGMLSETQVDEILLADIIVSGKRRDDGSEVYLVVEVSWGVGVHDVERAAKRARLLSQIGTPAVSVVAGQWITPDAQQLADLEKTWQLANGRTVIPQYTEGGT